MFKFGFREWGESQAHKYYDELTAAMTHIQNNPSIGIACDYIKIGYRQHHVNHHVIFYRVSATSIRILRVLREEMNFKLHLQ